MLIRMGNAFLKGSGAQPHRKIDYLRPRVQNNNIVESVLFSYTPVEGRTLKL